MNGSMQDDFEDSAPVETDDEDDSDDEDEDSRHSKMMKNGKVKGKDAPL